MLQKIRTIINYTFSYILKNYILLFLFLATVIKLIYINTFVLRVTWPANQFYDGVLMSVALPALLYAPILLMKKTKNRKSIALSIIISFVLLIDVVYFSYFASLPSINLISSAGEAGGVVPAIVALLHPGLLLLFVDVFIVAIAHKFMNKKTAAIEFTVKKLRLTNAGVILFVLLSFGASVNSVGLNRLDDVINKGYDSTSTAQYFSVLGAHVIDISRFIIQETTTLSEDQIADLRNWVNNNKPSIVANNYTGVAKNKNIIMIQVESLGGFVINQTINDKEITPNLNKLIDSTHYYPNNRFVMGAGHTSDTDFVANTSFFPLDDAATLVRYGLDNFTSLPKVLNELDYSTYAYHGFNRNFWNRDIAYKSLGYQKFYASDNFSSEEHLNMGLNDGTFFEETADFIRDQPKPSFSYAITLTSHTPFNVNDDTRELGITLDDYPNQVGGYLENINYVDRMIGNFFEKLKEYNLYEDSLIIIYGDHTPVLESFTAGSITYDNESVQEEEVPLFIKLPNSDESKTHVNKGTNLDLMPTVLDLIGVKTNFLMFGQSLFTEEADSLPICDNQMAVFTSVSDCNEMLLIEKQKSEQIIRYNQFSNISQ